MSFEELCKKLGGRVEQDRYLGVLRCVVHRYEWYPKAEEMGILEEMIRDATRRGVKAEIFIGNRLLGGWEEGIGIDVDPASRSVSVWSKVYSEESYSPENVVDVSNEIIEKSAKFNGFNVSMEAYVDQNRATDDYAGYGEASTSIPLDALSRDVLKKAIDAVVKAAGEGAEEAIEKLIELTPTQW